jgi:hypothetical protein
MTIRADRTMGWWMSVLLSVLLPLSLAEQYSLDIPNVNTGNAVFAGGRVPVWSTRSLQLEDPCYFEGDKSDEGTYLVCNDAFEVGDATNLTTITFQARCDIDQIDPSIEFDYRRASGCVCQASVSKPNLEPKTCACTICQAGFGNTPINVNCSATTDIDETADHYIYSTCTSVDCSGACNGSCNLSCDESGSSCPFCAATNMPTGAPAVSALTPVIPSTSPAIGSKVPAHDSVAATKAPIDLPAVSASKKNVPSLAMWIPIFLSAVSLTRCVSG